MGAVRHDAVRMALFHPQRRLMAALALGGVLLAAGYLAPSPSPPAAKAGIAVLAGPVVTHTAQPDAPLGHPSMRAAYPIPSTDRTVASGANFVWDVGYISYGPTDYSQVYFGEGAVMVADDPLQNITLFGGLQHGNLTNLTVLYNATTGYFFPILPSPGPSPRTNSSFVSFPSLGYAVLFGGLTNVTSGVTANDTWLYYFGNSTWRNVSSSVAPVARESAAMAADPSRGIALLEGGRSPNYHSGGSTGSVVWNDTWIFNATTFQWARTASGPSVRPMYASSMIYDPTLDSFLLFGGCAQTCSATLWNYTFGAVGWNTISTSGRAPGPRGAAAFVWDSYDQLGLLVGGFHVSNDQVAGYNDSFSLSADATYWTAVTAPNGPPAIYDAPSAWVNSSVCTGLNIVGGNLGVDYPPSNYYVLMPLAITLPNCIPNGSTGGGGGPPPPTNCTNGTFRRVTVLVNDSVTGLPLPGAHVKISGRCETVALIANSTGEVSAEVGLPDNITFGLIRTDYYSNQSTVAIALPPPPLVGLQMDPLPSLVVRTFGSNESLAPFPLSNVTVDLGSLRILGVSDSQGWLNVSHVPFAAVNITLNGTRDGYSSASTTAALPHLGRAWANLTLLAFGHLTVFAHVGAHETPIGTASGVITPAAWKTQAPTDFHVGMSTGRFEIALTQGNYSVEVSAPGYLPFSTSNLTFVPWRTTVFVDAPLYPVYGANVTVRVLDLENHLAIAGSTVYVGNVLTALTGTTGEANFTDVQPPGRYIIEAFAQGFQPNSTVVQLNYREALPTVVLELKPLTACPPAFPCPTRFQQPPPQPFGFLGGLGWAAAIVFAAPVAFALLGALIVLRGTSHFTTRARGRMPPRTFDEIRT